jgi:hypothetical protein
MKFKNRHGDIFNFTKDSNNNILWEGNFNYIRVGYPNDYTEAHKAFLNDFPEETISYEDFQNLVHKYDDEKEDYVLGIKYIQLINPITDKIEYVDPSGGPFIGIGTNMGDYSKDFKNMIVKDLLITEKGYKLIIKN